MIQTIWGYSIDAESLPDILTAEEFNAMTGGKYAGDARIESAIKGAQEAARNYCGWHIAPSMTCEFKERAVNKRIASVCRDLLVMLPATFVSEVISVEVDGKICTDYTMEAAGVLRVFDVGCVNRKDIVSVLYIAGVSADSAAALLSTITDRATHALSSSRGITSETTGGVSITYNAAWANGGNASSLATSDRDVLETYRLQEVF